MNASLFEIKRAGDLEKIRLKSNYDQLDIFYEIVRKIDDHTQITVDPIQGIANQNSILVPKVYFSTEEMNCSCQFRISKYGKRDWTVVDQQPRAKCRKKTLVTNK